MISTSELFAAKIAESSRQFRARLLHEGNEISGSIRSITINKGACGEDTFSIGSVFSSYIEVVIDGCEDTLENKEIQLQIGLVLEGEAIEYLSIGYYTVTKPRNTAYQTTFTGVGRISTKLNVLLDVPAVCSVQNIANAITEKTGIEIIFNGLIPTGEIVQDLIGLTCKEALEVITSVLGGFATEDSQGNIVISKLTTADPIGYDGSSMTELPVFNDYNYTITGVKVVVSEQGEDEDGDIIPELSFTQGVPKQVLSNPYMTQELFAAFATNTVGYSYRPGTVPLALGDPRLEAWDCLAVTDVKGNIHTVPCLNIVHTFDGGLSTTITAPGDSESEEECQTKGPITQQLERMSALLITAQDAIIKRLKADEAELLYARIKDLEAVNAKIENITAGTVTTEYLEANYAALKDLQTAQAEILMITGDFASYKEITTQKINAAEGDIGVIAGELADYEVVIAESLKAMDATIKNLNTDKLSAKDAELKYANIDFANIGTAAIEKFFSKSGMISDLVVGDGTITGKLVGVTIIGDLIEGGTVKADKLVVQGEDGLYYKLNVSGETVEKEQTEYNSLNGSIITAKSIAAEKVRVEDLVAFGATIGGFHITDNSVHSGAKESVDNTTRGIYMDNDGQLAFGDASNFIKFFQDEEGRYRLAISAEQITFSASGKDMEAELNNLEEDLASVSEETGSLNEALFGSESEDGEENNTGLIDRISEIDTDMGDLKADLEEYKGAAAKESGEIVDIINEIEAKQGEYNKDVADLEGYAQALKERADELETYVRVVGEGLLIGANEETFNTLVTPTSLNFRDGKDVTAYISNNAFHLKRGVVESLRIGNYVMRPEENGTFNIEYDPV